MLYRTFKKNLAALCTIMIIPFLSYKIQASGIPVVDIASLTQALQSAINQGTQIANQASQISNQIQSIQNQIRSLETLDKTNFDILNTNFSQQFSQISSVLSAANYVGFDLANVRSQFEALFPSGTDWETIDSSQYQDFYRQWNNTLSDSAKVAMEAQATIRQIQQRNTDAQNILSSVSEADGEVRQLQANNQMLSVMSQQIGDLNQTMATSGRISATLAAKSAAEYEAKRKAKISLMNNYPARGERIAPPPVISKLPEVKQ